MPALIGVGLAVSLAVPIGIAGAAASPKAATSHPAIVKGATINIAQGSWATLDPGAAIAQLSVAPLYGMVFGHLFFQNLAGTITPDLALSYTTSPNGLTGYLQLRHGVKFTDGTTFDAQAVVWNFLRYENATATPGPCPCLQQLSPVKSQKASGKYEVIFQFSHPYYLFQMLLAQAQFTYMLDPASYAKQGATQFGITPVGAGPFKVSQNNVSVSLTLVKNPGYYVKGQPYLNQINVTAIAQASQLYTGVSSGTLAFAGFGSTANPTYVFEARSQSNLSVIPQPLLGNIFMQLNVNSPPFDNPVARQALYEATNPQPIAHSLVGNGAVQSYLLNPPGTQYYPGNKPTAGYWSYNPTGAQQLVQQLGGLSFVMIPVSTDANIEAIETALQQEWNAVGMHVTINNVSHNVQVADQDTGAYQAILSSFGSYTNPFLTVQPFVASGTTNNGYGYHSSKIDGLLAKIGETPLANKAAITSDWAQIATLENANGANLPLFVGRTTEVANKMLHGVQWEGEQTYYETAWWG